MGPVACLPVREKFVDLMVAGVLAVPVRTTTLVMKGLVVLHSVMERNVETTDVEEPVAFVQIRPNPRVKKEFVRPPVSPIASIKNVDMTDAVGPVDCVSTQETPCVQTECVVPMRAAVRMVVCWSGRFSLRREAFQLPERKCS